MYFVNTFNFVTIKFCYLEIPYVTYTLGMLPRVI